MKIEIKNININYKYNDIGSDVTMILLHGWGQNIEMMEPIANNYSKTFNTFILDLPGFGQSDEPDYAWSILDYANFLKEVIDHFQFKKVILVGHSFGGRISLLYSAIYEVQKLVCIASPYCPEIKELPLKNKIYKKLKSINGLKWLSNIMKKYVGSKDYNNASEVMRQVLVKAVNTNLEEEVKKIECPTLLIWGDLDTAVPVKRAYELQNLIKDAGVVVYNGASHYVYLERINELVLVLDNFFGVRR